LALHTLALSTVDIDVAVVPKVRDRSNFSVTPHFGEGPEWGRVSDAGPARAVDPVIGPASESHRRTNPRESGEGLVVYGDLARQRLCRGMVLARWQRAERL
jgi:hypothetical protein